MPSLTNPSDTLTMVERNNIADRADPVPLRNQLTHEQWVKAMPPLYIKEVNFVHWDKFEWEVCQKWLAQNTTGWWYWNTGKWLAFEKMEDHMLFTFWAKDAPMNNPDNMNIEIA